MMPLSSIATTSTITSALYFLLLLLQSCPNFVTSYTILGGIDDHSSTDDDEQSKEDDTIIQETLRHFSPPRQRVVQLRTQTHETSGRVSMAGTLWEASPLLADYISNPACSPLFKNDDASTLTCSQPRSVVELGSGVGLASLAAAFTGCRVVATDGSPSSIKLLNENFERYKNDCPVAPHAVYLEWGDISTIESIIHNQLLGKLPDVIMASDVVYAHSAREELSQTIRKLCPKGHIHGRVVLAHRWRTDPSDEESFFHSFHDEFDINQLGLEYFPEDEYYRTRSMIDMRYPMSIFEMRRKW